MGLIDELTGGLVGLDTSVIIYYVSDDPKYSTLLTPLFERIAAKELAGVTSVITLTETLVHPFRVNDSALVEQLKAMLLETDQILTWHLTPDIAEYAAQLRAQYGYRTPDAIQLATAIAAGAETFVTNDHRLKSPAGLKVIVLDDFV